LFFAKELFKKLKRCALKLKVASTKPKIKRASLKLRKIKYLFLKTTKDGRDLKNL